MLGPGLLSVHLCLHLSPAGRAVDLTDSPVNFQAGWMAGGGAGSGTCFCREELEG